MTEDEEIQLGSGPTKGAPFGGEPVVCLDEERTALAEAPIRCEGSFQERITARWPAIREPARIVMLWRPTFLRLQELQISNRVILDASDSHIIQPGEIVSATFYVRVECPRIFTVSLLLAQLKPDSSPLPLTRDREGAEHENDEPQD